MKILVAGLLLVLLVAVIIVVTTTSRRVDYTPQDDGDRDNGRDRHKGPPQDPDDQ